jgi:hypothetical protein
MRQWKSGGERQNPCSRSPSSVTAKSSAYFSNSASSRVSGSNFGTSPSTALRISMSIFASRRTARTFFGVLRRVAAFKARTCLRSPNSPFPEKFYRTIDFRRQAFVHRTIERGLLEHFALRMILWQRNMDFGRQSSDPTRRVLRHFLLH